MLPEAQFLIKRLASNTSISFATSSSRVIGMHIGAQNLSAALSINLTQACTPFITGRNDSVLQILSETS